MDAVIASQESCASQRIDYMLKNFQHILCPFQVRFHISIIFIHSQDISEKNDFIDVLFLALDLRVLSSGTIT